MGYPVQKYSRSQVNRAGNYILNWNWESKSRPDIEKLLTSYVILGNWRSLHSYPLNTFNSTLRDKVKRLKFKGCIIAQRLKRTPSIIRKLNGLSL